MFQTMSEKKVKQSLPNVRGQENFQISGLIVSEIASTHFGINRSMAATCIWQNIVEFVIAISNIKRFF